MNKSASFTAPLLASRLLSSKIKELKFLWNGAAPEAGQFFMLKPPGARTFLCRPFGVASAENGEISFIIEEKGEGSAALLALIPGAPVELTGPLGNSFERLIPAGASRLALVSGGTGIAPLRHLAARRENFEPPRNDAECASSINKIQKISFFAGFKHGFNDKTINPLFEGLLPLVEHFVFASEDGVFPELSAKTGALSCKTAICSNHKGFVTDSLGEALKKEKFDAVIACGPPAMMSKTAALCRQADVCCIVSIERRMACGVGACLGCVVKTVHGNRRCCADGPVFNAKEIIW
ncbi:MAG: dihydroorotate dehydrogenase electron transfer subunit [Termitinemataceae bacterium]|nr:MAG: dihydroorotate dehydrogenase electron transfer subunit [Termitinemataceae bacterium]